MYGDIREFIGVDEPLNIGEMLYSCLVLGELGCRTCDHFEGK